MTLTGDSTSLATPLQESELPAGILNKGIQTDSLYSDFYHPPPPDVDPHEYHSKHPEPVHSFPQRLSLSLNQFVPSVNLEELTVVIDAFFKCQMISDEVGLGVLDKRDIPKDKAPWTAAPFRRGILILITCCKVVLLKSLRFLDTAVPYSRIAGISALAAKPGNSAHPSTPAPGTGIKSPGWKEVKITDVKDIKRTNYQKRI